MKHVSSGLRNDTIRYIRFDYLPIDIGFWTMPARLQQYENEPVTGEMRVQITFEASKVCSGLHFWLLEELRSH